jgi:hypothetical protein
MDYALLAYRSGRHLPLGPAALVLDQLWGPGLELLIVVVLLFPDGRLSSRFGAGPCALTGSYTRASWWR